MNAVGVNGIRIPVPVERRQRPRYPFRANVRFRRLGLRNSQFSSGEVLNMNSRALYIQPHELSPRNGERVEASIEWPAPLHGTVPMQLLVTGYVVRVDRSGFVIEFYEREFRTLSRQTLVRVSKTDWAIPPVEALR